LQAFPNKQTKEKELNMNTPKYTVTVMLTALPQWLQLSRGERNSFIGREVGPILAKYEGHITVRWLDCEAFTARCSDMAVFETANLQDYYFLMEELRDTGLFARPYFKLEDVVIGLEDGFRAFEAQPV
jgi:hypothetical protein